MELIDFIVKKGTGKNTPLDKAYTHLLNNVLITMDDEQEERWGIYNLMIKEMFQIDDGIYFQEIKYRLTDGEDPNEVFLDVVARYGTDEITSMLYFLNKRVKEYEEEDFYKRFYK